jgi:hypothetical protein
VAADYRDADSALNPSSSTKVCHPDDHLAGC